MSTFAKEYIFVSGGFNGIIAFKSVEYFSVRNNQWVIAPDMIKRRTNHS